MTEKDNSSTYVVTREDEKENLSSNDGSLMKVHALNAEYSVEVLLRFDGSVFAQCKTYVGIDEWGDNEYDFKKAECKTHDSFKQFLDDNNIILPKGFFALVESGELPISGVYEPVLADVIGLQGEPYSAIWCLSYESPDDDYNYYDANSLTEVMDILERSGAMQIAAGNYGSVSIGSFELFSTTFRSQGMDMGDSHINPRMDRDTTKLFDEIMKYEKELSKKNEQKDEKNFHPSVDSNSLHP